MSSSASQEATPSILSQASSHAGDQLHRESIRHLIAKSDAFVVSHVTPHAMGRIDKERGEDGQGFRVFLYRSENEILFITIPTHTHEVNHLRLDRLCYDIAAGMGLGSEWAPVGATTYEKRDSVTNIIYTQGEGDSGMRPLYQRPAPGGFPTLVIEAGVTQSRSSLRMKANWWFATSENHVKIVLLVKVDFRDKSIVIEKWKAESQNPPSVARRITRAATRAAQALTPTAVQTVTIKRAAGIGPTSPRKGLLRLEFENLFLRQPTGNESDIILGTTELQVYASDVWRTLNT
ncbi:hypothetical protein GGS23DRAFT_603850 [Durotheca rogersii]|uniref:uncharacterized protein n=1 Tax=Durotheca rogersii TaxID=419775 RepID=UPI002220F925|nr:uncharacterized protein GGS23DRAFT_603850 [Durotheca rogersii]KAI5865219.1 hypothetical protein GGS23DRAFT_603850 [Durotheca rogersii]